MIRYGIGTNYLPDWGYKEAMREIYQNFLDAGPYEEQVLAKTTTGVIVELSNSWKPEDNTFLKIGESGKRDNSNTIGQHGEGMKMAMMVLLRNRCASRIIHSGKVFRATQYSDDFLGDCFGLSVSNILDEDDINSENGWPDERFRFIFHVPEEEYDAVKNQKLKPEDVIYNHQYGDVINRTPGDIYVGGQFVSNLPNMTRAYNFMPQFVKLDRDRSVPRTWDVEYYASAILSSWEETDINDLMSRDCAYISKLPKDAVKQFKPSVVDNNVIFSHKEHVAPPKLRELLMEVPANKREVKKLKYKISKKRKPLSILTEYFDKHPAHETEHKLEIEILLKKAKGWK